MIKLCGKQHTEFEGLNSQYKDSEREIRSQKKFVPFLYIDMNRQELYLCLYQKL